MQVQLRVAQGKGLPQALELDAPSLDDARRQATALGYTVLSCQSTGWNRSLWQFGRNSQTPFDIPVFIEQLRDLLLAGLSVIEAIDALRRGAKSSSATVVARIERHLREGQALSAALASDPLFPSLLVSLVRASELTSDLPQTLTRFLEHDRRVSEVRHRLVSTAIYPSLLMGVGSLVLVFLLFYVMPRFARIFDGMTGDLPWSARAMVAWAHWLSGGGRWVTAALLVAGILAAMALTSPALRARLLQSVLAWKPLRGRLTAYFLSQWYRATGMLVQGGIPLPQALKLANQLLPTGLQLRAQGVLLAVTEGQSPSAAYLRGQMATPIAEQLLLAGERTGELGDVLMRIAHFHEVEIGRTLERTMRTLEPVVMVMIGLGVGLVVVLMYMPIFELAAAIQ